jgi:hypothetical protein
VNCSHDVSVKESNGKERGQRENKNGRNGAQKARKNKE